MRDLRNSVLCTIKKFQSNEDGYFAALFGIMLISITATSGAVVDFMTVQNTRSVVQQALDTTTLALQPLIHTKTEAQLLVSAQNLMDQIADIQGFALTVETVDEVEDDGTLFIEVSVDIPMYFVSLVGVGDITARIASQVTKKATQQEVVMVLDNSGSMGSYSRLSNLKTAAVNATNILMGGASANNEVKIGIVPFTSYVNVGVHNNAQAWMDVAGRADISNDNFDNDNNDSNTFTRRVNRLSLYNRIRVNWGGCVEARAHYSTGGGNHLDTDDTTPTAANRNTQFTPLFMPDERDSSGSYANSYTSDHPSSCRRNVNGLSTQERQERLCKYSRQASVSGSGPNDDCPATPILPLTTTVGDVTSLINGMNASGGTNIHQGAVWGLRALSPSAPFTQGGDYDVELSKVMIIMTDGQNTHPSRNNINGSRWHSAYGYPRNGRLGAVGWSTSQLQREMDIRTERSCLSAKDEDIVVYTIGLNPPSSATRTMLENCATSLGHAYFPNNPSDLDAVFQTIANQIVAARISQ